MAQEKVDTREPILARVKEQEELLRVLLLKIDNLTERNPKSETEKQPEKIRETNVFDEIINILSECKNLIFEADEKILFGINKKVQ